MKSCYNVIESRQIVQRIRKQPSAAHTDRQTPNKEEGDYPTGREVAISTGERSTHTHHAAVIHPGALVGLYSLRRVD